MVRRLNDYGMLVVLLLLCALFSVLTVRDQQPNDAAAAQELAQSIVRSFGSGARVLIATRDLADDKVFAEALSGALTRGGVNVVKQVAGEPKDARQALQGLATQGRPLDAIACNPSAATWLVFASVAEDFPVLGKPRLMRSSGSKWPAFLSAGNLINIANQIAVIAILAIGMTLVIVGGGIDLSVGSLIALSAVICCMIIRDVFGAEHATMGGMIAASLAAVAVCGLIGAASGIVITGLDIAPFIVTLATMLITSGLAYLLAQGQSVYQVPDSFIWLGRGADLAGMPNAVLLMLLLYALAHLLMKHATFGRHLYAVGGNRDAAVVSGVRVKRVLLLAYIASGALAGLGGVVMASQLKSGSPTYGQMYELYVIAAVVVGGASLNGGRGKMAGTLIGALIIAVIQNGMNLANIESYTQKVVLGLVVLAAVVVDRVKGRAAV
ncbi:MAG: ABC transporter permease [Verrucomicrobiaceae bacterium]|nr:ABC transporter permease [Verrucomicrobiaceae bacterium]